MKKMLFIYNPNAGKGLIKGKLADILDVFVKEAYEVVIYPTQASQDAYQKVLGMREGYDLVVCSGGDGTLDEVVTGMMGREKDKRVPIGYIPAGTTNDFANSLNISKDMLKAAEVAVHGQKFSCDVGKFNEDIFVYVAAFGLFTDVPYQTDQKLKSMFGHAAYVLEGAKRLANIPSYHIKITYGEEVIEDEFMIGMITNSRSVAGIRNLSGKNTELDDGQFEVTMIKRPKNPIDLQNLITALLIEEFNSEFMYSFKAGEIKLESEEEIPWTLDGEFGGEHTYVEILNKNKALTIMVEDSTEE